MKADYYKLRDSLRKSIMNQVGRSEAEFDPSVVGWAAYAALQEDKSTGGAVGGLRTILEREKARWAGGSIQGRDLAAIAALVLLEREHASAGVSALDILRGLVGAAQAGGRLSAARLPDQLFLVSLAMKEAEASERQRLVKLIREQLGGPVHRQVLLHAALVELGEIVVAPALDGEDIADAVASLWWQVRYTGGPDAVVKWERLDQLLPGADLGDPDAIADRGLRTFGPWEKALAFECLCKELNSINPWTLFELYPLHPRVKKIARPYFEKEQYPTAIVQATQVLNELLQQKTGDRALGERQLVTRWLDGKPPRLALNDQISDPAGLDDHEGVRLIMHGVFTAFRNPPGHRPEDNPLLARSPHEAMDQLVTISYLMRRIERAKLASVEEV